MPHILFVCTGNIFRSMIAENALRHAAGSDAPYIFSSAGTEAKTQVMVDIVREGLLKRGIDPTGHVQRRLTTELLDSADGVVAMGLDHAEFIKTHFQREVKLFNEVAYGRREAILDTWEAVPDYAVNPLARDAHINRVVDHICTAAIPFLANADTI